MIDIAEQICLAVDQIVTEKIRSINYDTTIVATIVSVQDAEDYKYICSNGSSQFVAYAKDTTYKVGESVQVTVPNNDYNNQKVIIGKYVAETNEPFVYVKPFDTFVDVTANLIDIPISASLLANDPDEEEIYLWSRCFRDRLRGYDRLGIQGQFRSWLKYLNPADGDYGYYLEVYAASDNLTENENALNSLLELYADIEKGSDYSYWKTVVKKIPELWFTNLENENYNTRDTFISVFEKSSTSTETKKQMIQLLIRYSGEIIVTRLYFNTKDMQGNPYNYQNYSEQEAVFDIESLGSIVFMSLYFYQTAGSFVLSETDINTGESIPMPYMQGSTKYPDNLFTKDAYICLGHNLANFDKEQAILYSIDGDKYLIKDIVDPSANWKTIRLRWLHEFEDGRIGVVSESTPHILPISEDPENGYDIRWYQYDLGAPSSDEYSGAFWTRLTILEDEQKGDETSFVDSESIFNCSLRPRTNKQHEQIKAVIIYNNKVIRSNILTFSNEVETSSAATATAVGGLSLWCEDESYGNYFVYGQDNKLMEMDDLSKNSILTLQAKFADASLLAVEEEIDIKACDLTEAKEITWEFPLTSTMIKVEGFDYDYLKNGKAATAENKYKLDGYFVDADVTVNEEGAYPSIIITRYGDPGSGYSINSEQNYLIKDFYNKTSINNTVKCAIKKDNLSYTTSKEFTFGIRGTSGTDATVVVDFVNNITSLTANKDEAVKVVCRLYDSSYKEVETSYDNIDLNNLEHGALVNWRWAYYYEELDDSDFNAAAQYYLDSYLKTVSPDAWGSVSSLSDEQKEGWRYDIILYYANAGLASIKIVLPEGASNSPYCHLSHNKLDLVTLRNKKFYIVLEATVTGYGDYDLSVYFPVPIKATDQLLESEYKYTWYSSGNNISNAVHAETCTYVIGPTSVIYSSSGTVSYYKDPVRLYSSVLQPEKSIVYVQANINETQYKANREQYYLYDISTRQYYIPNANKAFDADLVYYEQSFEDIVKIEDITQEKKLLWQVYTPYVSTSITKGIDVADISNQNILKPPSLYIQGAPAYGIWLEDVLQVDETDSVKSANFKKYYVTQSVAKNTFGYESSAVYVAVADIIAKKGNTITFNNYKNVTYYILAPIWIQPIVTLQNEYFSTTINKWDGKSVQVSEEGGYIIAPAIAAGNKDSRNRFSGVVLGDWSQVEGSTAAEIADQTGVYGFHQGAMSYAFTENGHAFIGKSGRGRIYFNGDEGQITSGAWGLNGKYHGMFIDLDDGILKMQSESEYTLLPQTQKVLNKDITYYTCKLVWKQIEYESDYDKNETYYIQFISDGDYTACSFPRGDYIQVNSSGDILPYEQGTEPKSGYSIKPFEDWNTVNDSYLTDTVGHYFIKVYEYTAISYQDLMALLSVDNEEIQEIYVKSSSVGRYITLSAAENRFPLAIGTAESVVSRNFRVSWDGTAYIKDGIFSGNVYADYLYCEWGYIGGWIIEDPQLRSANNEIILDSSDGSITGGILRGTNASYSAEGGKYQNMRLVGYLNVCNPDDEDATNGYMGFVTSGLPGMEDKTGIGFIYDGNPASATMKTTGANAGFSYYSLGISNDKSLGGYCSIASDGAVLCGVHGTPAYVRGYNGAQLTLGGSTSGGDVLLSCAEGKTITLKAGESATGSIQFNCKTFTVTSSGDISITTSSGSATLKGTSSATVEATSGSATLKGSTNAAVEAGSEASLKGSTVKISGATTISDGALTINSSSVKLTCGAGNQEGIYARFG